MSEINSAKKSFQWSFLIQMANQVFGFAVSIILARILPPADFGVLGILAIFINLAKKVTDGGFVASLIRAKNVNNVDFSTVFYFNLITSVLLYVLLFSLAPFIARYFEIPLVLDLIRIYGLTLIVSAFTFTQSVILNKALNFKMQFKIIFPSLLLSGMIGIVAACQGFGIWSLVFKELTFTLFASVQLWYFSRWRPLWVFDRDVFKKHFNFGYKLVLTDLTSQLFKDSYKVIISKFFSPAQLGYFTRANSMEELPSAIVFNTTNRVLFPLLSQVQDDHMRLKNVYSQIIRVVTFLVTPFLMLLYLVAEPLFVFLLTEKWMPAVSYFKILIIAGMIAPFQPYLLNICKVKGRSDLVLKLSIVENFLIASGTLAIIPFGMKGLLWGLVIATLAKLIVAMFFAGKLIEYSMKEQLLDLKDGFLLSGIGYLLIASLNKFELIPVLRPFPTLIILVTIYYGVLFLVCVIFRLDSFVLLKRLFTRK